MASFDDAITKLLWPEKRQGDKQYMTRSGKLVPGVIDRTTETSFLRVQGGFLPDFLQPLVGFFSHWLPWLFGEGGVEIGPIPKGTPINLISNIDLSSSKVQLLKLLLQIKKDLKALPRDATDEQGRAALAGLVVTRDADCRVASSAVKAAVQEMFDRPNLLPEAKQKVPSTRQLRATPCVVRSLPNPDAIRG